MLPLVLLLTLAQGGPPPNPQALPPRADPRMILDGRVVAPRVRAAERRTRAVYERVMEVVKRKDLQPSFDEIKLLVAVSNAAIPAAFLDDKAAQERLHKAVRELQAEASPPVLAAIQDLDLTEPVGGR